MKAAQLESFFFSNVVNTSKEIGLPVPIAYGRIMLLDRHCDLMAAN